MLDQVDLTLSLSAAAYKIIGRDLQRRLVELAYTMYDQGLPTVIVFEGWDAAGKGTSIVELTRRMDPRGFKVLSTQAPRTHERKRPWLWRFWMDIPRRGQIAIFDRSWYGRVLVERVQGLTPVPEWIRAYEEINAFERTLADDNTLLVKFWLHISPEEQLRRFLWLSQQKEFAWQVTAEDWENHRKYNETLAAVQDMLVNTHTAYAPWTMIPATNKPYRMTQIYQTLINRFEQTLGETPSEWPPLADLETLAAEAMAQKAQKKAKKAAAKKKMNKKAAKAEKKAAKLAQAEAEIEMEKEAGSALIATESEVPGAGDALAQSLDLANTTHPQEDALTSPAANHGDEAHA